MPETIVMIHGMWGGAWCWDRYRPFFEERGYRCLVPVLRHHDVRPGDPPDPALGTVSLRDYADDLEKVIRGLEDRPVVMGHSMGGIIAQILAARGLAAKLVLLTPAPPYGIVALKPSVIKAFLGIMTTWGFWRKPMKIAFKPAAESMMLAMPEAEQRETYAKFVPESGRAAFEIGLWLLDSKKAARVDEKRVACPVLVVGGERDGITPPAVVRQVARKYGAEYRQFPGHAHFVISEPGWEEIAESVDRWLKATKD
jgi:pimeloyl-ACP methyl ester carboxylesterase